MKKVIISSVISILINSLIFISLYNNLKNAEYENLGFSIYIILATIMGSVIFIVLLLSKSIRTNVFALIFLFFSFLGSTVFIISACIAIGGGASWAFVLLNIVFTGYAAEVLYQKLKSDTKENN
jgi:hypothetical protein